MSADFVNPGCGLQPFSQCAASIIQAAIFSPAEPPIDERQIIILTAIASVAVIAWTGGLIARSVNKATTLTLVFAMNVLQLAFFAPIVLILATPNVLRLISLLYLALLINEYRGYLKLLADPNRRGFVFMVRTTDLVRRLEPRAVTFWHLGQIVQFAPYAIIVIFPRIGVGTVITAIALFVGYQSMFFSLYPDMFE